MRAADIEATIAEVQAEDVARAIALVIARKGVTGDGGFNSIDKAELIAETAEQMWPHILDEARAAMKACGVG